MCIQVVERIRRDITNSSPESGSNLHLTRSYLASHIGRLSDKCVNVIYQLVNIQFFFSLDLLSQFDYLSGLSSCQILEQEGDIGGNC